MSQTKAPPKVKAVRQRFRNEVVTEIVGYRLRRAQVQVFQEFNARFADYQLRPAEYSALALIAANPGSKQIEVANALGIKRANFVALINMLETRGLIDRRQPANDRRSHALFLTAEGESLMEKLDVAQAEFEAECVRKLGGPAAREQLMDLLDRLIDSGG
jgi:DNA-binding MarR family transcriptional regulator